MLPVTQPWRVLDCPSRRFMIALTVAILSVALPYPSYAADGELNAAAYEAIPAGAQVSVRLLDNTIDNTELKHRFEDELVARGFRLSETDAQFILSFATHGSYRPGRNGEDRTNAYYLDKRDNYRPMDDRDSRINFFDLGAHGGNTEESQAEAKVRLFSSQGGSVINQGTRRQQFGTTRHSLEATVKDTRSGRRVWQANAFAMVSGGDPATVAESLIPVVMGSFGQTVRQQKFSLE
ncbi:MAG: hypothetical protein R3E60_04640 [Alphaproteobacteria bacterium]